MNDSQQAMFKGMKSVVADISRKVDLLHQQNQTWSRNHERHIRLVDMQQEADELVNILTDQFTHVTPELRSSVDRHFDDLRERLVALQTRLNAFARQYSGV